MAQKAPRKDPRTITRLCDNLSMSKEQREKYLETTRSLLGCGVEGPPKDVQVCLEGLAASFVDSNASTHFDEAANLIISYPDGRAKIQALVLRTLKSQNRSKVRILKKDREMKAGTLSKETADKRTPRLPSCLEKSDDLSCVSFRTRGLADADKLQHTADAQRQSASESLIQLRYSNELDRQPAMESRQLIKEQGSGEATAKRVRVGDYHTFRSDAVAYTPTVEYLYRGSCFKFPSAEAKTAVLESILRGICDDLDTICLGAQADRHVIGEERQAREAVQAVAKRLSTKIAAALENKAIAKRCIL